MRIIEILLEAREEIQNLYNRDTDLTERITEILDGINTIHYQEIYQAEREGRLVVLPCKVGDAVYYLTGRDIVGRSQHYFSRIEESKARGFHINEDGLRTQLDCNWQGNHGTYGRFGKTIFLAREEAEAALKGEIK